jgi:hypothetical protein
MESPHPSSVHSVHHQVKLILGQVIVKVLPFIVASLKDFSLELSTPTIYNKQRNFELCFPLYTENTSDDI